MEIREPVEIRAIPVAVSADACILSGEFRSLGKPEKAGGGVDGLVRTCQSEDLQTVRFKARSISRKPWQRGTDVPELAGMNSALRLRALQYHI